MQLEEKQIMINTKQFYSHIIQTPPCRKKFAILGIGLFITVFIKNRVAHSGKKKKILYTVEISVIV